MLLLLACAIPYGRFLMGFSLISARWSSTTSCATTTTRSPTAPPSSSSSSTDVGYWEHPFSIVARRLLLSIRHELMSACLAWPREYPYAPLLLLFFLAPGFLRSEKRGRSREGAALRRSVRALSFALISSPPSPWTAVGRVGDQRQQLGPAEQAAVHADAVLRTSAPQCRGPLRLAYPSASALLESTPDQVLASTDRVATVRNAVARLGQRAGAEHRRRLARCRRHVIRHMLEGGCRRERLDTQPCLSVLIFWVSAFVTAAAGYLAAALAPARALLAEIRGQRRRRERRRPPLDPVVCVGAGALWNSASIAGAGMGVARVIQPVVVPRIERDDDRAHRSPL